MILLYPTLTFLKIGYKKLIYIYTSAHMNVNAENNIVKTVGYTNFVYGIKLIRWIGIDVMNHI